MFESRSSSPLVAEAAVPRPTRGTDVGVPPQRSTTEPPTRIEAPATEGTLAPNPTVTEISTPTSGEVSGEAVRADEPVVPDFPSALMRVDAAAADGDPYVVVQAIRDAQSLINHCQGRLVELAQGLYVTYRRQLILEDDELPAAVADLLDDTEAVTPTHTADPSETATTGETAGTAVTRVPPVGDVIDAAVEELADSDGDIGYWLYHLIHKDVARMVTAEVAAAVGWSPREASSAVGAWLSWDTPAEQLLTDAMVAGQLEVRKAGVIADGIAPMTNTEDRERVCRLVLPRATALPRRRLKQLVDSLVGQLDPATLEERHAREVADRALILDEGVDNTTIIKALGVPPDQAAAAYHRVDTLARCAKDAGDTRTVNQLRCDLTIALLTGTAQFHNPDGDSDLDGDSDNNPANPTTPASPTAAARSHVFPLPSSIEQGSTTRRQQTTGLPDTVLTVPLETLLTWFGITTRPSHGTEQTDRRAPAPRPPVHADRVGPLLDTIAKRILAGRLDAAARGEGEWRLAVTDKNGRVVQYHALHTRTLRGLQREAMAVDQAWCVFPTCTKPALRCQADHATAFSQVRETRLDNMDPLCAPDHAVKTAGGYRIVRVSANDPANPERGWELIMRSKHRYRTPDPVPPRITDPESDSTDDPPPF